MTATCYTEHHGIHKIQIELGKDGYLPQFGTVAIKDEHGDHKFDPRKDWDGWINSDLDPRVKLIRVERFAGTVYIEATMQFMKNRPITPVPFDDGTVWLKRVYEYSNTNPYGHVKIGVS